MAPSTPAERAAEGRRARKVAPRSGHGEWEPAAHRTDPLAILALQATTRVEDLVPIRYGRMAASPFAFFRGAAAVMAADLAGRPRTGLDVQLCGDAHLSNFGGFASPEREMLFDVNDFDETLPGPFEWDVQRLVASLEVATRERGFDGKLRRTIVAKGAAAYRTAMAEFAGMRTLDLWYTRLDGDALVARWGHEASDKIMGNFERSVAKAQTKDHLKALTKLTETVGGTLRFVNDPPLMVPVADILTDLVSQGPLPDLFAERSEYQHSLPGALRHLFSRYEIVDLARKVVGVGSVGTRCWVALFVGRDQGDPLLLQVKQAEHSVLEPFLRPSAYAHQGRRVVEGQQLTQSASDIFLGWERLAGDDDVVRDFYVRQLWDWKLSADVETMAPEGLGIYAQMCGWTLARAHARTGDPVAIAAYLGSGDRFDAALCRFAESYADQNERDFDRLTKAIADGSVHAVTGV